MTEQQLYVGQNVAKDCVVGDRAMNRYCVFNGLMLPLRIDHNLLASLLGVRQASPPTDVTVSAAVGALVDGQWYSYVAVYASSMHLRPTAVLDGSGNFTRGNPSTPVSVQVIGANRAYLVRIPSIDQDGITHVFLYRSLGAASQAEAEAGPFYYVGQAENVGAVVSITDGLADGAVGMAAEADNYPPNAYRYAIAAMGFIFAGGNFLLGSGYTCTVTAGSSTVTLSEDILYDGVRGWTFKLTDDTTGGVDGAGSYYVDYVDSRTLTLVDGSGNATTYDGPSSGSDNDFVTFLPGYVLRWCKQGEPEAWPASNLINFEGDITGLGMLPNQPLLVVCTDEPSIYVLDITLIGSDTFKTNRRIVSSEYTASSHYSLLPVNGSLRGIDAHKGCIIEIDGVLVRDITQAKVPRIFEYLTDDLDNIKNWHCAYDWRQHLFGAFVTFRGSHRTIDFCIGQNTLTGEWFFNLEKDLLSSAEYKSPESGEVMVLGGTQGIEGGGGVWGRIWAPNIYDEWLPEGYLRSGTISEVISSTEIEVDTTDNALFAGAQGLQGRWVLVCAGTGEYAQLAYIQSNTANRIVIDSVLNGMDAQQFSPTPSVGWRFYLGLIEIRWGPKKFDFGDPDVLKKIWEVWCTVDGHNEDDCPFIRLYRGFETSYATQLSLKERINLDRTETQSLVNKVESKLESVPRWGVAMYDRSYGPTRLHSITLVFSPTGQMVKERK